MSKGYWIVRVDINDPDTYKKYVAANAAAFVGVIATSPFARATPIAVFAAVLIAWSRVHLGVHYVGDVLLGALLGITIGTALGAYLPERVLRSAFGFLPRRSKP